MNVKAAVVFRFDPLYSDYVRLVLFSKGERPGDQGPTHSIQFGTVDKAVAWCKHEYGIDPTIY